MINRFCVTSVVLLSLVTATVHTQEPGPELPPAKSVAEPVVATTQTATAAPVRIARNAVLFVEPSDFGKALAAAILKKQVPVRVTTDPEKADFFVATASQASQEKTAERVTKVVMLGAFAGSGRRFDATVTVTNHDGMIVFAHNSKKENFQSAAENVAKGLKKHIEGK